MNWKGFMNWKIKVAMAVWTLVICSFLTVVIIIQHPTFMHLAGPVVGLVGGIAGLRSGLKQKAEGHRGSSV